MNKIISIILFSLSSYVFSQNTSLQIEITDSQGLNDIFVDCSYPVDTDRCFVLQVDYTTIYETTNYQVASIPYTALTGLTNETIITVSGDDKWSTTLQLPFDFCFYNEGYDEFILGDNGIISFNTSLALEDSQYLAGTIPNSSMPTNAIFGVFHDLTNDDNVFGCTDDPSTPENECGEIKTYVIGTSPERAFVISYENINHFNCENVRSSSQIVLYETTNIIDVYVQEKPVNCEPNPILYRKNALIGIQNQDASLALAPPGRNTGIWSATNEAWRFTPDGIPTTVIQWQDENGVNISNDDQITICPEQNTYYSVTVIYDFCNGNTLISNDIINITIDLLYPIAIDNEVNICDINIIGEEIIDLTSYDSLMIGSQTGLVLSYYNSLTDAQTETSPITNPTNYLLNNSTEIIYVKLLRGIDCFDVGQLTLNLEELGSSQLPEIVLCDMDNDNSEVITLSDYTSQIIGSQTNVNIVYYPTFADAQDNTNPITSIIASNGDSVFVKLTLQPDDSCPNIEEIPISLQTEPTVEPVDITLCSNILVYDLTQHEADIQLNNTEILSFSYHLSQSHATNNILPIDPLDAANYILNSVSTIWVRTVNTNGCLNVFPINFNYIDGVTVNNDTQVSIGNIFNLTNSIADMVMDLTGISVAYYDSQVGAQMLDPGSLITDPVNYQITNPEEEVFIVFTNTVSGCVTIGTIQLETVGFGGTGGNTSLGICDENNDNDELVDLDSYTEMVLAGYDDAQYMEVTYHLLASDANANINPITTLNLTTPITISARIALVFENVELDFIVIDVMLDFLATFELNPVNIIICDEFNNNSEPYDLTQHEDDISTEAGVIFEYFNADGSSITNPQNFNANSPPTTVDVNVLAVNDCLFTTTITINFHPEIDANNATLQRCDADDDGEHSFNLDDALLDINVNFIIGLPI